MAGSVEKIYAQALLEIAAEDGSAKELDQELTALSEIFSANPDFTDVLCAPTVTDEEKFGLIRSVFDGKISETALNFLCVITEKGRCRYLPAVAKEFRKGYYRLSGISEVTVTTVVPLKDNARAKLIEKLKKMYGGEIILVEKLNPSIVGGMIITCGDSTLDGSVKTKLENMHRQIRDMIAG